MDSILLQVFPHRIRGLEHIIIITINNIYSGNFYDPYVKLPERGRDYILRGHTPVRAETSLLPSSLPDFRKRVSKNCAIIYFCLL